MSEFNHINLENESLVVSYYLNHFDKIEYFESEYFQDETLKNLVKLLQSVKENNSIKKFDIDILNVEIQNQKSVKISYQNLKTLKESYVEFSNINYCIDLLKSDFQKQVVSKNLLQTLVGKVNSAGIIKTEDIITDLQKIEQSLSVDQEEIFLDAKDLSERFSETLKNRSDKTKSKSLGFQVLDKNLTRPGAPKEITIIAALRGVGKSTFKQNMENNLINKGIPVISYSLEMSEESSMDRHISMKTSTSMIDLNKSSEQILNSSKVKRYLEEFKLKQNFLFTDKSDFSFVKLDKSIYQAKKIFREKGVFKDREEYMLITIDVLNMIIDFGEQEPTSILKAMDKLHHIVKKHNIHCIGIVQINETKLRGGRIWKDPEDLDLYRPNLEDIYGGSGYAQRARVVGILNRPKFLKERMFPEMQHIWDVEPDVLQFHCAKQNDGQLFLEKFIFDAERMRVLPYLENYEND